MNISQNIVKCAKNYCKDYKVVDLVIGLSLIACQLDNGAVGVSYVIRDGLPPECNAFGFAQEVIGKPARDIIDLFINGENNVEKSVGSAVLCALSQQVEGIVDDKDKSRMFDLDFDASDTVGMIGLIGPVAATLENKVKKLYVFDESISNFGTSSEVCAMDLQPTILPLCNKMVITGSSTINGSIDGLLDMCCNAKDIAMVGTSTPMFPEAWAGTKVTRLAGSWWDNTSKNEIFKNISLAGGIFSVKKYMRPKVVKV